VRGAPPSLLPGGGLQRQHQAAVARLHRHHHRARGRRRGCRGEGQNRTGLSRLRRTRTKQAFAAPTRMQQSWLTEAHGWGGRAGLARPRRVDRHHLEGQVLPAGQARRSDGARRGQGWRCPGELAAPDPVLGDWRAAVGGGGRCEGDGDGPGLVVGRGGLQRGSARGRGCSQAQGPSVRAKNPRIRI
jgi:hypothetical protein